MTQQEYEIICAEIDSILSELGPDFNDDDPRIELLIKLSDKADEYFKEQHTEGYTDIEISLETQLLVKIIRMARERNLCTNEFIVECLEVFVEKYNKTANMKNEQIIVPRGNSKDAVKRRERIIYDFYKEWRKEHQEQKMFNLSLREDINIRQVSMLETMEHAAKSYLSTLAVLQLDAILTNSIVVRTVPKDPNSKNQEKFDKMIIMQYQCPGIGSVKLTVGVMRRTHDKVQYCITAISPDTKKAP